MLFFVLKEIIERFICTGSKANMVEYGQGSKSEKNKAEFRMKGDISKNKFQGK